MSGIDDVEIPDAEPVSCVSDTSPEEDVAMCLMMLSRDDGGRNPEKKRVVEDGVEDSAVQKKQQHQCEICKKWFRSSQALGGHRIIHRKKVVENKQKSFRSGCNLTHAHKRNRDYTEESSRIFDCPFCGKVFGSGQALGGHKRSHLMGGFGRSSSSGAGGVEKITSGGNSCIDLNMPAPTEDEDVYSVVSDDGGGGGDGPINYH
ncbi:hypothetical protein MLD38_010678 [Melastoma candidum]|nr:hypothetical protein MLD38_010678 [Melastoma candidum]